MFLRGAFGILLGLAQGMLTGAAFAAIINALDLMPFAAYYTQTGRYLEIYGYSMVLGAMAIAFLELLGARLGLPAVSAVFFGTLYGVFDGLFLCSLAETTDFLTISVGRINLGRMIKWGVWVLVLGKIFGALSVWFIPALWE